MAGLAFIGLFAFSVVFAVGAFIFGHDHDSDHDMGGGDHDAGGGHDTEAGGMPSVFSTRTISLFLVGFSGMGLVCTYGLHWSAWFSSAAGLAFGVFMGALAYVFVLMLYRQQATSMPVSADYAGLEARVSSNIPANGTGQISVAVLGQLKTIFATAGDGRAIPEGRRVRIIAMSGATATVELIAQKSRQT